MKTSHKFFIDRGVATPLAWGLNLAARVAGQILDRDHEMAGREVRSIVVAKLLGMGSILQATPLLTELKRRFPAAKLIFVTTAANRGLMDRLECIDETLYIDDQDSVTLISSCVKVASALVQRQIDLYFDLEIYSAGASILSLLSCARNRYGFYRHTARFKRGTYTHLVYFNTHEPISRLYLQLGRAAGIREIRDYDFGPITINKTDIDNLQLKLKALEFDPNRGYILINPNASDLLLERRWPINNFAELIEELTCRERQVLLVGAPSEAAYVSELQGILSKNARKHVINTAGQLSVGELFALIKGADCVVTNDTGPMHFSIALHRPTVCLFGPVSPEHYGVQRSHVKVLYHPVFCSPCVHEIDEPPCNGNNVCMQLITTQEVLAAVEALLGEQPSGRSTMVDKQSSTHYSDLQGMALGVVARSSLPVIQANRS